MNLGFFSVPINTNSSHKQILTYASRTPFNYRYEFFAIFLPPLNIVKQPARRYLSASNPLARMRAFQSSGWCQQSQSSTQSLLHVAKIANESIEIPPSGGFSLNHKQPSLKLLAQCVDPLEREMQATGIGHVHGRLEHVWLGHACWRVSVLTYTVPGGNP